MNLICGIDVGLHGSVAMLPVEPYHPGSPDAVAMLVPMPIMRHPKGRGFTFDIPAMWQLIYTRCPDHTFIEAAQPFPGQGVVSVATTARGLALWEGLFHPQKYPYTIVRPKAWQKVMLAGMPKGDTKAASIQRAKELFPGVNLRPGKCRTDQHGLSDALLIAEYGRRQRYQAVAGSRDPHRKPGHHRSPMAAK